MLEAKNLVKIYKPKKGVPIKALDGVSLKFPEKGMVFLLGKSGCGKSTLLNLLGGLDKYNSGEIIIKGASSKEFRQKHFDSYRNTYVGFIFQEYNVLDEFTVGANIALAIELQNKKATDEQINEILREVDLVGFGNRKPNELSGGQKQRVAIARALVKNPEIIMADEPTGALDSVTGKQVFETLKKLSREKLVIVVSHDREFAENYADRIIELSDGVVISDVELAEESKSNKADGLTFAGNTVEIPCDYRLTEQDRKAINEYIEKIKSGSVSLNITENVSSAKKFIQTDESKIKSQDSSAFKLIKSKLPLKNAFKIGASSLKYKKFRLAVTIFLSCVAFGLFGLADTFTSYNHIEACTNSLYDTGVDYISTAKSKKIENEKRSYWLNYSYKFTEKEVETFEKETGIKGYGVYVPYGKDLFFESNVDQSLLYDEDDMNSFHITQFSGFAEINEKNLKELGFKILAGKLPDGNKNEIAISKQVFEFFQKFNYLDGSFSIVNGQEKYNVTDIKNPADMVGKVITLDEEPYTVTAVIDTKLNLERYEALFETEEYMENSQYLKNLFLATEFETVLEYSFAGVAMVGEGAVDRMIEKTPNHACISNGLFEFSSENAYMSSEYMARLSDVADKEIIWIDSKKTKLQRNEIIVTSDLLYNWYLNQEDTFTAQETENNINTTINEIRNSEDFELIHSTEEMSSPQFEKGYKIVGVIDSEKMNYESTVVCADEFYHVYTDGKEAIYDFIVSAAPQTKAEIKDFVNYCYKEDGTYRHQIQNAVTFELDSLDELLNLVAGVFFYIGIGFALFAALMLANFISVSISYKKQEIGILKAIGSRSNDIFRIFFAESFIIAMINFIISTVGVFMSAIFINTLIRNEIGILVTVLNFNLRQVALLFVISIFVAFVASYLPVKKIASKLPVDAIKSI